MTCPLAKRNFTGRANFHSNGTFAEVISSLGQVVVQAPFGPPFIVKIDKTNSEGFDKGGTFF